MNLLKIAATCTLALLFSFAAFAERTTVSEYVERYKDLAISEMYRVGIPASIKLGQGILESDSGNSDLCKNSNNHFGIKCKEEWTGPTYAHKDDDYIDGKLVKSCFRAYSSSYDSYIDHSNFLKNRDRYQILFYFHHTDYQQWAHGLKAAGYATAVGYAEKLIGIIERYNLHQYDFYPDYNRDLAMATHFTFTEGEALKVFGQKPKPTEVPVIEVGLPVTIIPVATPPKPTLFPAFDKPYFEINKSVAVTYQGSLALIAAQNDKRPKQILRYNEVKSEKELLENQYLFLIKKQKTHPAATHTVQIGETMYVIAQRYGIQLKQLYKLNKMKKGTEPMIGAVIILGK